MFSPDREYLSVASATTPYTSMCIAMLHFYKGNKPKFPIASTFCRK
jgi:hypothetical protein